MLLWLVVMTMRMMEEGRVSGSNSTSTFRLGSRGNPALESRRTS